MLKYYNNNSNNNIINIDLELIRYKCFLKIQKSLQYLITKYFNTILFSKKKNYNITINNIFSSLIFSQYIYKNSDIFIPKLHNIDIFKKTIKHYIKDDINMISKLKDFINEFIKIYNNNYYYFLKKTKNNGLFYKWLNEYENLSCRRVSWFKYLAKNLNKYSYILGNKNTNYKDLILIHV